jgi:uncharacterized SAM-binding protein YcdF (DUF218 family)
MLITLKFVLRSLVLPPAGPLLLAALGTWLLVRRRTGGAARTAAVALVVVSLATLWLLATPAIADTLTRLAGHYPALDPDSPVRGQAIVILAGGSARMAPEYGGPAVGLVTLERVSYGAYLARRTGLPVLVSGSPREALGMRATLARDFGIAARWVNGESRDTFDDAQLSARLLKADGVARIVLVTSATHEWRAAQEFESAGLAVEPAPVHVWAPQPGELQDYFPDAVGLLQSREALYEILGNGVRQILVVTHLRRHGP